MAHLSPLTSRQLSENTRIALCLQAYHEVLELFRNGTLVPFRSSPPMWYVRVLASTALVMGTTEGGEVMNRLSRHRWGHLGRLRKWQWVRVLEAVVLDV